MQPTKTPTRLPAVLPWALSLLSLALLLGLRAQASELFRLDRIAIVRITDVGNDQLWIQQAVLESDGKVTPRAGHRIDRPANTSEWALNRDLVEVATWIGYRQLGGMATAGFSILEGGVRARVGDTDYFFVGVDPDAPQGTGRLINISTRARLANESDVVIAGFVIEDRERLVLVRVIGPALADFDVTDAALDPVLSINRGSQVLHSNDNWSADPHAADAAVAAGRVGAFPLPENSHDAAVLVRLPPGIYTVQGQARAATRSGGTILIEVYSVPDTGEYGS